MIDAYCADGPADDDSGLESSQADGISPSPTGNSVGAGQGQASGQAAPSDRLGELSWLWPQDPLRLRHSLAAAAALPLDSTARTASHHEWFHMTCCISMWWSGHCGTLSQSTLSSFKLCRHSWSSCSTVCQEGATSQAAGFPAPNPATHHRVSLLLCLTNVLPGHRKSTALSALGHGPSSGHCLRAGGSIRHTVGFLGKGRPPAGAAVLP